MLLVFHNHKCDINVISRGSRNHCPFAVFWGEIMKIAFYFVDEKYIDFLKGKEILKRGFTTVPNVEYQNRSKFLYGTVLDINGIKYFVPVSSYDKKQQDNMLIKISSHKKEKVVGSLRFNYMIPVPDKCLKVFDFKNSIEDSARRIFVEKEYRFCKSKLSSIQKTARKTYERVITSDNEELIRNSCDFKLLEQAYNEYIINYL